MKLIYFYLFVFLIYTQAAFAEPASSLKVGDFLKPFALTTDPHDFTYRPNGFAQMVSVYPASLKSSGNGKFNYKVIAAGFCPLSIIDVKNKSWYAPKSVAVNAVHDSTEKDEHNPICTVSIDHEGVAVKHWQLNRKATTMIVDGAGKILFIEEGVLNKKSQKTVIKLLKERGKAYTEWPDK